MDIRRQHAEAGLTSGRLKRKFGRSDVASAAASTPEDGIASEDDSIDFEAFTAQLIADSIEAEGDPDVFEPPPMDPGTSANTGTSQRTSRLGSKTCIPLQDLFRFPGAHS